MRLAPLKALHPAGHGSTSEMGGRGMTALLEKSIYMTFLCKCVCECVCIRVVW